MVRLSAESLIALLMPMDSVPLACDAYAFEEERVAC